MAYQVEFRKALAELSTEEIAQKAKEAQLVTISCVRIRENDYAATQTEAFDASLVRQMDLFYESICGMTWHELVGARYSKKFHRWTVTHCKGVYYWKDVILVGDGTGTVRRAFQEAGITLDMPTNKPIRNW